MLDCKAKSLKADVSFPWSETLWSVKLLFVFFKSSHVIMVERLDSLVVFPLGSRALHSAERHFTKKKTACKSSKRWIDSGVAEGTVAWTKLSSGARCGSVTLSLLIFDTAVVYSCLCEVTALHVSEPPWAVGFGQVISKITLLLQVFGSLVLFPDTFLILVHILCPEEL